MLMKHSLIKHLLILPFILFCCGAFAQNKEADAIVGNWYNQEKTAKINVFLSSTGSYYGSISWLKEPLEDGKPKVDKHNPDEKLKSKPILGLMILRGFQYKGSKIWEDGRIYDPKNGKDYSCKLTLIDKNQLNVRGFVGISIIGRTQIWTKAE